MEKCHLSGENGGKKIAMNFSRILGSSLGLHLVEREEIMLKNV